MSVAPLPLNEEERLEILERYRILDTLAAQQFDDLTLLAAQICDAPISLISLIDQDRQWFKSRYGLDIAETPRAISFCAHSILQNRVMEVPDAAEDARFADNPLVTGAPHIRFYAGAPLLTPTGHAMGTLCVIDSKPRHLTPTQLKSLEALARQTVSQLELWRTIRQLEVANGERSIALNVAQETASRLAETEGRFRQFMDNSPLVAWIKDEAGRYLYINQPFERTFHTTARERRGKDDFAFFVPEIAEVMRAHDAEVLATNRTLETYEVAPTPDGVTHEWLVFKFPIQEASGAFSMGGVALDVTEQRRTERLKSEFVSVVSHELRTPLTSIRGALGLLAGGVAGEMSASARQMIDIAQKNGDRLILLINDILDIEKIESGKMRFEVRPFALQPWLLDSVEQNRSYGAPLGVKIEVETWSEDEETWLLADKNRLDQVLSNLLSNACKWTPREGVVRVKVEILGSRAFISVQDEGPGVPPEFVPHLFEKFGQADSSSTRQQGGTGLGLTIARAIIEKLDGHIEYFAPPIGAKGATFRFDVPLGVAEIAAPPLPNPLAKLLICEDDPEVAALLSAIALQNGWKTAIAGTLQEARELIATGEFVGMSLDLTLPDGDGLDLLHELREAGNDLPVVVISARSEAGELHGEALQILDWLEKPLDPERLLGALEQFRGERSARVLHVEDDADVRHIVSAILGAETQIVAASTLREAREQLARRRFDLAILDLDLRDGNGLDLIEELNASTPPTPVILFSAREPNAQQSQFVAASLVKSRTANDELRGTILRFLRPGAARIALPTPE